MANQSPIFSDQLLVIGGNEYGKIFNLIETTRNFNILLVCTQVEFNKK